MGEVLGNAHLRDRIAIDRDGAPLSFNNPTPLLPGVITAGPPLHAALMARRRPA